jgi:hypothetical protein
VSELVQCVITNAGLVLNTEKSRFEPSKRASWLGFDIDLESGKIHMYSSTGSKGEQAQGGVRV